jgi:hypothetical protein
MGSWQPQPYTTLAGSFQAEPTGWGAGVRAGVELPKTQPLVIRPSLTARVGRTPGVELGCTVAGGSYTCATDADVRQIYVYTAALESQVGLELLAEYLDRSRPSGLGAGLKLGGDWVVGHLPTTGVATSGGGDVPFAITGPRTFLGAAWRVTLVGTYTF